MNSGGQNSAPVMVLPLTETQKAQLVWGYFVLAHLEPPSEDVIAACIITQHPRRFPLLTRGVRVGGRSGVKGISDEVINLGVCRCRCSKGKAGLWSWVSPRCKIIWLRKSKSKCVFKLSIGFLP